MNVLEARVVLRDRTMLDVVDLTVRFIARAWRKYALLSLVVLTPAFAVTLGAALWLGWGWGWTLAILFGGFAAAPFTSLASRLLFESTTSIRDVVRSVASALPRLVGVGLIEGLGVGFLGMMLLVPAIWPLAVFFYSNEVVVLERAGVGAAISRLQRLLSGQSGDVLLALLFLTALHVVAVFLGDFVGRSLLEDVLEVTAPASLFQAKGSILGLASFWLFVPFAATCRFLLYINARTRTEGWDVQTRFAAVAARAQDDEARDSISPRRAA